MQKIDKWDDLKRKNTAAILKDFGNTLSLKQNPTVEERQIMGMYLSQIAESIDL